MKFAIQRLFLKGQWNTKAVSFVNKETSKAFEGCSLPVMENNDYQECKRKVS